MATDLSDIKLSAEQRKLLLESAQQSGRSWTELLSELLLPLATVDEEFASPDEWNKALQNWSRKPRVGNADMDDSRDAIYEGRGE